jgi:hypothetical protein
LRGAAVLAATSDPESSHVIERTRFPESGVPGPAVRTGFAAEL